MRRLLPVHISHGRSATLVTKDRHTGAGRLLPQLQSDLRHGLAGRAQPQRLMPLHAWPPTRTCNSRFFSTRLRARASRHRGHGGPVVNGRHVFWMCHDLCGHERQRRRKRQRHGQRISRVGHRSRIQDREKQPLWLGRCLLRVHRSPRGDLLAEKQKQLRPLKRAHLFRQRGAALIWPSDGPTRDGMASCGFEGRVFRRHETHHARGNHHRLVCGSESDEARLHTTEHRSRVAMPLLRREAPRRLRAANDFWSTHHHDWRLCRGVCLRS
jgi:hypothetical protein